MDTSHIHHTLQHTATYCNALELCTWRLPSSPTVIHCNTLTATHCDTILVYLVTTHCGTYCNIFQHSNTLQHTACRPCRHRLHHTLQDTWRQCNPMRVDFVSIACITHGTPRNTLQLTATHCNPLQHIATHCNPLLKTATHCNPLRIDLVSIAYITHCSTLQPIATHHKKLQPTACLPTLSASPTSHTATHCNTLQHTKQNCNPLQTTACLPCQHRLHPVQRMSSTHTPTFTTPVATPTATASPENEKGACNWIVSESLHANMYTCIHVYIYIYIMCIYIYYVHIYIYKYVYVFVYVYMYMYTYTYTYIYIHITYYIHIYTYTCTYIYIYIHTWTYIFMYVGI